MENLELMFLNLIMKSKENKGKPQTACFFIGKNKIEITLEVRSFRKWLFGKEGEKIFIKGESNEQTT
jgi:hypothetical protein